MPMANGLSLWRSHPYGDGLNSMAVFTVPALQHKHCFATAFAANWCSKGPSGQIVPTSHFAHCSRNYFYFVITKMTRFLSFLMQLKRWVGVVNRESLAACKQSLPLNAVLWGGEPDKGYNCLILLQQIAGFLKKQTGQLR